MSSQARPSRQSPENYCVIPLAIVAADFDKARRMGFEVGTVAFVDDVRIAGDDRPYDGLVGCVRRVHRPFQLGFLPNNRVHGTEVCNACYRNE